MWTDQEQTQDFPEPRALETGELGGVVEEFVDDDVLERIKINGIEPTWGTADRIAGRPGLRIVFPVGRTGEHE